MLLRTEPERSEQALELFTLPDTQQVDRITSVALPELKCPDSTDRRPAVLALVPSVTVVEEFELPAINLHGHKTVVDLIP